MVKVGWSHEMSPWPAWRCTGCGLALLQSRSFAAVDMSVFSLQSAWCSITGDGKANQRGLVWLGVARSGSGKRAQVFSLNENWCDFLQHRQSVLRCMNIQPQPMKCFWSIFVCERNFYTLTWRGRRIIGPWSLIRADIQHFPIIGIGDFSVR